MSKLVYSIQEIFSEDKQEGVLGYTEAVKYYIAPYQRGYKWSSDTPNSPVWLLMTDIKDAFEGKEEEYYLQYITVKQNSPNGQKVLEVIDGQQRLTTLTLIFSVLAWKLNDKSKTISSNKLSYKVRENINLFFKEYIYNGVEQIIEKTWEDFIVEKPNYDNQDIFYIFNALQCIHNQLPHDIEGFYKYLCDNVKIIFNDIGKGNLSSEKVFSNLNTNKVDLTSTELVKGLFLTRAARESQDEKTSQNFKEVLELRATMGRQWDEMANWAEQADIKTFYFSDFPEPLSGLVYLLGLKYRYSQQGKSKSKYDLFNFFQTLIKRNNVSALTLFSELRQFYFKLRDWHIQPFFHNLFGYLFFYKDSDFKLSDVLTYYQKDTNALRKEIITKILELIEIDTDDAEYGKTNGNIHKLLLFINVFGFDGKFNFNDFSDKKWSLEHIFPQTPDFLPDELKAKDIELIFKLLSENWENELKIKYQLEVDEQEAQSKVDDIKNKLNSGSCQLSENEKTLLYQVMNKNKLNSIGNMALLSGGDNSSNSNGLFDAKRQNIVKLISRGSFVPPHTYDVFSKLLSDKMEPDLTVWTEDDINAHESWINERIEIIKKSLKNEQK
jgi:hypothetical protein